MAFGVFVALAAEVAVGDGDGEATVVGLGETTGVGVAVGLGIRTAAAAAVGDAGPPTAVAVDGTGLPSLGETRIASITLPTSNAPSPGARASPTREAPFDRGHHAYPLWDRR